MDEFLDGLLAKRILLALVKEPVQIHGGLLIARVRGQPENHVRKAGFPDALLRAQLGKGLAVEIHAYAARLALYLAIALRYSFLLLFFLESRSMWPLATSPRSLLPAAIAGFS